MRKGIHDKVSICSIAVLDRRARFWVDNMVENAVEGTIEAG